MERVPLLVVVAHSIAVGKSESKRPLPTFKVGWMNNILMDFKGMGR
jgi:hypothetical protein